MSLRAPAKRPNVMQKRLPMNPKRLAMMPETTPKEVSKVRLSAVAARWP